MPVSLVTPQKSGGIRLNLSEALSRLGWTPFPLSAQSGSHDFRGHSIRQRPALWEGEAPKPGVQGFTPSTSFL